MSKMVKVVQRNARHPSRPSQLQLDEGSWAAVGDLVGWNVGLPGGEIWRVTAIISQPFRIAKGQWSGMVVDAEFVQMARPAHTH